MPKKTSSQSDPWKPAQPYILQGLQQSGAVQQEQQPKLNAYSGAQMGTYGRLAPGAEAGIMGAQGLVNDTIGGKYLNANPYMAGMMKTTNDNITNGVNSQFEQGGRYGSAGHAGILAQRIGEADNSLQFQNYSDERNRQTQAIGQSEDLMRGSQATLNNAAELPWIGVSALNGNVRQASQGYGSTSTTTSDPMGQMTGLIGAGASAYSAYKSDERIKNVGKQVGTTPDGLPIYDYTYKGDPQQTPQTGVMAQDVEKVRPDAMGPTDAQGVKSVDYGKLGLPDPTTMAQGGANPITPQQFGLPDQASMAQGGADAIAPQQLAKVYNNSDNVDRSLGGILGRFANPDPEDKWGKIGLLGQRLMASSGSPFQALGEGLIGSQRDASDRAAAKNDSEMKGLLAIGKYNKDMRPEHGTVGKTAGAYDNAGQFHPSYTEPAAPEKPTDLSRNFKLWQSLPPGPDRDRLGLALQGGQFTAPAVAASASRAAAVGEAAGIARDNHRAPQRASMISGTAAAKYRSDASIAIAHGADPVKVHARLAEIGVQ